jgi:hypothetical protein
MRAGGRVQGFKGTCVCRTARRVWWVRLVVRARMATHELRTKQTRPGGCQCTHSNVHAIYESCESHAHLTSRAGKRVPSQSLSSPSSLSPLVPQHETESWWDIRSLVCAGHRPAESVLPCPPKVPSHFASTAPRHSSRLKSSSPTRLESTSSSARQHANSRPIPTASHSRACLPRNCAA